MSDDEALSPPPSPTYMGFQKWYRLSIDDLPLIRPPKHHMLAHVTGGLAELYDIVSEDKKKRGKENKLTENDEGNDKEAIKKNENKGSCKQDDEGGGKVNNDLDKKNTPKDQDSDVEDEEEEETTPYTDEEGEFNPDATMPLLAQRYRHVKVLARGQSALIIKAQDTFAKDRPVAIKVLHRVYKPIGSQEADILLELHHSDPWLHVPFARLQNQFLYGPHYCLVFEYLSPTPLYTHYDQRDIRDSKSLPHIRNLTVKLLTVMGFLHKQNVIHADLKPENILLRDEEDMASVMVVDFGNALRNTDEELSLYYSDFELQTLLYRAPEVIFGMKFSLEVDMWSLGCLLAECYIGEPLFMGKTKKDILTKITALLGPFPKDFAEGECAEEFLDFIGRPLSRYQRIENLRTSLNGCKDFNFLLLIEKMLTFLPERRINPFEAACQPFVAMVNPFLYLSSSSGLTKYPTIQLDMATYPYLPTLPEDENDSDTFVHCRNRLVSYSNGNKNKRIREIAIRQSTPPLLNSEEINLESEDEKSAVKMKQNDFQSKTDNIDLNNIKEKLDVSVNSEKVTDKTLELDDDDDNVNETADQSETEKMEVDEDENSNKEPSAGGKDKNVTEMDSSKDSDKNSDKSDKPESSKKNSESKDADNKDKKTSDGNESSENDLDKSDKNTDTPIDDTEADKENTNKDDKSKTDAKEDSSKSDSPKEGENEDGEKKDKDKKEDDDIEVTESITKPKPSGPNKALLQKLANRGKKDPNVSGTDVKETLKSMGLRCEDFTISVYSREQAHAILRKQGVEVTNHGYSQYRNHPQPQGRRMPRGAGGMSHFPQRIPGINNRRPLQRPSPAKVPSAPPPPTPSEEDDDDCVILDPPDAPTPIPKPIVRPSPSQARPRLPQQFQLMGTTVQVSRGTKRYMRGGYQPPSKKQMMYQRRFYQNHAAHYYDDEEDDMDAMEPGGRNESSVQDTLKRLENYNISITCRRGGSRQPRPPMHPSRRMRRFGPESEEDEEDVARFLECQIGADEEEYLRSLEEADMADYEYPSADVSVEEIPEDDFEDEELERQIRDIERRKKIRQAEREAMKLMKLKKQKEALAAAKECLSLEASDKENPAKDNEKDIEENNSEIEKDKEPVETNDTNETNESNSKEDNDIKKLEESDSNTNKIDSVDKSPEPATANEKEDENVNKNDDSSNKGTTESNENEQEKEKDKDNCEEKEKEEKNEEPKDKDDLEKDTSLPDDDDLDEELENQLLEGGGSDLDDGDENDDNNLLEEDEI